MALKNYDSDQITISFGPILITDGYAEGEFLNISQTTPDFISKVGTDGQVTRSKTNDARAIITLTLMQSSDHNIALSALNNADKAVPNGAGVVPMLIRDRAGTTVFTAQNAWIIQGPPSVTFDQTATPREWVFECEKLVRLDGGN